MKSLDKLLNHSAKKSIVIMWPACFVVQELSSQMVRGIDKTCYFIAMPSTKPTQLKLFNKAHVIKQITVIIQMG